MAPAEATSRCWGSPPATGSMKRAVGLLLPGRALAPGDRIYLFGFSRGAYTVRVLAGLIHKIGLISPEQANLAGSGLVAYKQYSGRARKGATSEDLKDVAIDEGPAAEAFDLAAQFARITSTRWPTIHFIGVWDTVASVIVPRRDNFYLRVQPGGARLHAAQSERSISARRSRSTSDAACSASSSMRSRRITGPSVARREEGAAGHFAGVVRRRALRRRRRLSGGRERRVQISADLDDRGGDKGGVELQPAHREPARLGHPAQELAVPIRAPPTPATAGAAQFDDGAGGCWNAAEERDVQGMAGAEGVSRILRPDVASRG